ncbi:hypothetical protein GCM10008931_15860 [Oceanobacillus oncorhynchi subsp. oncorhynchi]
MFTIPRGKVIIEALFNRVKIFKALGIYIYYHEASVFCSILARFNQSVYIFLLIELKQSAGSKIQNLVEKFIHTKGAE